VVSSIELLLVGFWNCIFVLEFGIFVLGWLGWLAGLDWVCFLGWDVWDGRMIVGIKYVDCGLLYVVSSR
jgi:hypothetical protein